MYLFFNLNTINNNQNKGYLLKKKNDLKKVNEKKR